MTDLERLLLNALIEARALIGVILSTNLPKHHIDARLDRWDQLIKDAEGM